MNGLCIAKQLLSALDRLIVEVADDAVLREGLGRERCRLVTCLEHSLGCQLTEPPHLTLPIPVTDDTADLERRPRRGYASPVQRRLSVRWGCYGALASGILPSQRFDVLMLLSRRALRRQVHSVSSSDTPTSSSPDSSSGGSAGTGCGDNEGSAPLRMNFSSTSTICA